MNFQEHTYYVKNLLLLPLIVVINNPGRPQISDRYQHHSIDHHLAPGPWLTPDLDSESALCLIINLNKGRVFVRG